MDLAGKVVRCVRPMTRAELAREGWVSFAATLPLAIEFTDGTVVYPSADDEGNQPGALFGVADGKTFGLVARPQRRRS